MATCNAARACAQSVWLRQSRLAVLTDRPHGVQWACRGPSRGWRSCTRPRSTQARNDRWADTVELDDDGNDWSQVSNLSSFTGTAGRAWRVLQAGVSRLTDVACDVAPPSVDRGLVSLAVKAGLILLGLSVIRSALGLISTLGTLGLIGFIGLKLLRAADTRPDPQGARTNASQAGPRPRRTTTTKPRRSPFQLPGGDDSDLVDVWFDRSRQPGQQPR